MGSVSWTVLKNLLLVSVTVTVKALYGTGGAGSMLWAVSSWFSNSVLSERARKIGERAAAEVSAMAAIQRARRAGEY